MKKEHKEISKLMGVNSIEYLYLRHPSTVTYYINAYLNPKEEKRRKLEFKAAVATKMYKPKEYAKYKRDTIEAGKLGVSRLQKRRNDMKQFYKELADIGKE